MICSICGHENDDYQTICSNCNSPLTKGFIMCPSCGKIIKEDTKKCPRCKQNIFVRDEEDSSGNNYKVAYSPKYIVKAPLSIPTLILIMLVSAYILFLFVETLIEKFTGTTLTFKLVLNTILIYNVECILALAVLVLSTISFIKRLLVNKVKTVEELDKRLNALKVLYGVSVSSYLFLYLESIVPYSLSNPTTFNLVCLIAGGVIFILSLSSLLVFFKNSRVRTI